MSNNFFQILIPPKKVTVNMARNRKEASIIPSPFNFGAIFCDNIIDTELESKNPSDISNDLFTIVSSTDQNVSVAILLSLFSKIQKQENAELKQKLIDIVQTFVNLIQNQSWFRLIVLKFFNKLSEFPESVLHLLNSQTSLTLLVHAASTKFTTESQAFIQNNIIRNLSNTANAKLSQNVLYELCDLHIPDFDPDTIFGQKEAPEFSPYLSPVKLSSQQTNVEISSFENIPIQSVLAESNEKLISNKARLCELFSFYPDFNEYHAASFIFCLVQPHYHYKEFLEKKLEPDSRNRLLEMHKEIFESKNLSIPNIINHFQDLDTQQLQVDSCALLFTILGSLTHGQPINPLSFTSQWKNPQLQHSILSYITVNSVPNLDFSKTPKQINIDGFIPSGSSFDNCCNCWKSLEFVQRATQLLSNDSLMLNKFFEPLIQRYPAVLIAIFSRSDFTSTTNIIDISTQALAKLVHQNLSGIVNELFKTSSSFIILLLLNLYKNQPNVVDRIYTTFSDHINQLLESTDIFFATDCAMIAAVNKTIDIGKFIENYTKKNGPDSIQHIIDFIVQKVKHVNSQQLLVITNLFTYLSEHINEYTINQQIFIETATKSAAEIQPALVIPSYDIKVPQKMYTETKEQATQFMSKLLTNQISPNDFFSFLCKERFVNPLFFSETVLLIISEIERIDDLKIPTIKSLAKVTGELVISQHLNRSKTDKILQQIKILLNNEEQTQSYLFGIIALEVILPKIDNFPQFIFDVMRETRIRDLSPEIFDQIQKVGQKINEPLHSTLPKTINIHPLLQRFFTMKPPSPAVARSLLNLSQEPLSLHDLFKRQTLPYDWTALAVVDTIQDKPALLPAFIPSIMENPDFIPIVFHAAAARSLQHILSPEFGKYEGCLRRRRLYVLGNLIGTITLKENRPILSRFLDLKKLLLYGISQGKLYGIVPFVVTILQSASPFFNPPNPYTSGLLYILAGICCMDSIKVYIKEQILGLFNNMGITTAMFDNLPKYFPLNTDSNYDYLITPYSMIHFLSAPDIERITTFDTNSLSQFIQQNVIIPDNSEIPLTLKEKIKEMVVNYLVSFLHKDGPLLADKAANTTLELVRKDFKNAQAPEIMLEPAHQMVHQLSNSLTLFNAIYRIPANLVKKLHSIISAPDNDWIDEIAAKNYEWIAQVLRDSVAIRSWNTVKTILMKEIEEERHNRSRNFTTLPPGLSSNGCIQSQQVYSEYRDLSFSQQSYPFNKDDKVLIDKEFDEYLSEFKVIVPFEQSYTGNTPDDGSVNDLLDKCPNFVIETITFDRFKSILKSILKCASKCPSRPFEIVLCHVIEKVVTSVNPSIIKQSRQYVMSWVHNLLPPYIVCELVRLKLVVEKDLDIEFSTLMNSEPFNTRIMIHVMQALYFGMVETSKLNAREMISSLTYVCTILQSQLDILKDTQLSRYSQYLKSLTKVFETVFAPENGIPTDTRLSKLVTYDASENLTNQRHINAIQKWHAAYCDRDIMDYTEETKEVLVCGAPTIAALFCQESLKACNLFMDTVSKLQNTTQYALDVLEAASQNVKGIGNVIGHDMTKYYQIIRKCIVMLSNTDKFDQISMTLHNIRPSISPSFAFSWVQLISDKIFVSPLLSNNNSWTSFFVLLADYISSVGLMTKKMSDSDKEAFDVMYRALLRLILILSHDYNEFMASAAPLLVQIVPLSFTQLRNVLLSLDSKPNSSFTRAAQQFSFVPEKFRNNLNSAFPQKSFDKSQCLSCVQMITEKDSHVTLIYAFVSSVLQSMTYLKQADNTEESPAFMAMQVLFEECDASHAYDVICAIVDNVRGDEKEAANPKRLLLSLLNSTMSIKQGLTASELSLRAIFERCSAGAKPPNALQQFFKDILSQDSRTQFLSSMNYVKNNPLVIDYIQKNLANSRK